MKIWNGFPGVLSRTNFCIILLCLLVQGCGTTNSSVYPYAPEKARMSADALVHAMRKPDTTNPVTLDELKDVITSLRFETMAMADAKNEQSWHAGLATLAGGSMATVGSVTSRPGLTNSGLLLAFLGLAGDQFFKPATTLAIHLDADSKLQCLQDVTHGLSEDERKTAASVNFTGSDEARRAIHNVSHGINATMLSYRRALLGVRPTVPTREELLGLLKRFAAPEAGTKDTPGQDQMAQAAAAKKFVALDAAIQACVKLGVSNPQ